MLEKLSEIDWAELDTAYGSAEDVPDRIRALTSPHPSDWSEALFALEGTLLHQGSACNALVASIPFLLEILSSPDIHCRGHILSFLSGAMGGFYTGLATEEARKNKETWNSAIWIGERDELYRDCAKQIWQEWEMLLKLLHVPSVPIRVNIPVLLSMLVSCALTCVPLSLRGRDLVRECFEQMSQRLESESHILVRSSLIFGIAQLHSQCPGVLPLLRERLDETYSPQERLSAAWNLVQQGEDLPEATIEFLAEILRDFVRTDHLFEPDFPGIEWRYHPIKRAVFGIGIHAEQLGNEKDDPSDLYANEDISFPWGDGWPRFNTIICLCRQKRAKLPHLEVALLEALKSESPHTAERISRPILQHLFQCERLSQEMESLTLSPIQEEALTILYNHSELWTTNTANHKIIFDDFGLPLEREKWSRLLGREDRPHSIEASLELLERLVRKENFLPADVPLSTKDWEAVRWLCIRTLCSDFLIPFLQRLPNLESLDLCDSKVTDAGLKMLPLLPNLKILELVNLQITDAGLEFLRHQTALEELNLSGTSLSSRGLDHLTHLPKLKSLRLYNTSITNLAVIKFRLKKPQCKVELKW